MKIDGFLGAVLEPGDDGYEAARHIWNGDIKRPSSWPGALSVALASVRWRSDVYGQDW